MYIDGSNPETDHNLYTLDKNQPLLTYFNVSKAKSVLFYPRLKKTRTKQQKTGEKRINLQYQTPLKIFNWF